MGNLSLPEKDTLLSEPEKAEAVDVPAEAIKNSASAQADKGGKGNAADADLTEAQAEHGQPHDAEMIADAVSDAEPVAIVMPTVHEQYPGCQFSDDLLFRVTMTNKLETSVKVAVLFTPIEDSPANILYPLGEVTDYIKPGRTITFMTLRKKLVSGSAADFNMLEMTFAHSVH